MIDRAFADLRKLSDWFASCAHETASRSRSTITLARIAQRLGATAVPLLGRELRHASAIRREAAREALAMLAESGPRERVIAELRDVAADADDEAKVCALGLLAELGEHTAAQFTNPGAIQRRSALALAAQLDEPGDIANAANMMLGQLDEPDIVQMIEVLAEVAPAAAQRLAAELAIRLDLPVTARERIATHATGAPLAPRKPQRPTHVAVLVDATARIVVVASRKITGERRWRRWAVLIGTSGCLDDCLHEDADGHDGDAAPLIASLCADGYRVASSDVDHARTVVTAAVRCTVRTNRPLAPAYYLGRDLLDLADAHVVAAVPRSPASLLARAIDLLAAGDLAAAHELLTAGLGSPALESCELLGTLGACLLARGDAAAAIDPLERAIAADPAWPLHHYNLGVALHKTGDTRGCRDALRRFLATSTAPTGLRDDPAQPERIASAEHMVAAIDRHARLAGRATRLTAPRKKRARKR